MSGRGGNLKHPLKKVLINQPGPANLGVYRDSATNVRMLQFKKEGYTFPWLPGSTFVIQRPVAPVAKVSIVTLNNVAPVNRLNYPYGFSLLARHRKPGVNNSQFTGHQKFYGGLFPAVSTPTISNAELNQMRDSIIAQINADNGYNQSKPKYMHPGACAIAGIPLLLDTWNDATAITLDGTAIAAAANINAFVANINAIPGYLAISTGSTTITIIRNTRNNTPIVFTRTAGTANDVSGHGRIGLIQRYPEQTFEVVIKDISLAGSVTQRNTRFAFMTNDEVFQVFSHLPNLGFLGQMSRDSNVVLPNVNYLKIVIESPIKDYDHHGASQVNTFASALEIYIPEAEWDVPVNRWEAKVNNRIMDAGTVNDVVDLFTLWRS